MEDGWENIPVVRNFTWILKKHVLWKEKRIEKYFPWKEKNIKRGITMDKLEHAEKKVSGGKTWDSGPESQNEFIQRPLWAR